MSAMERFVDDWPRLELGVDRGTAKLKWDIARALDEGRFRASTELRHDQVYGIAVGWDANGSPVEAA